MSKELEALEEVNNLIDYYGEESTTYDSWQVIIEALKRAKKVEELLGLYRNSSMETDINYRMHYWQVIDDLEKEVFDIFKDLEKELEELK